MEKYLQNLDQISTEKLPYLAVWLDDNGINFDIENSDLNDMTEMFYLLSNTTMVLDHACSKLSTEDARKLRETFQILNSNRSKPVIEPIMMSQRT